jgi:hypothetical protein
MVAPEVVVVVVGIMLSAGLAVAEVAPLGLGLTEDLFSSRLRHLF